MVGGRACPPRAHPRSRGENFQAELEMIQDRGSSPLTRGKRGRTPAPRVGDRLIPAHAGKTASASAGSFRRAAHPRSRGENSRRPHKRTMLRGSSPLTRGKPGSRPGLAGRRGLIPAHAGKTLTQAPDELEAEAHPRSRGENFSAAMSSRCLQGSSPLTRGKRSCLPRTARTRGLIPAHAGKTARGGRVWRSFWAHPRSRGENEQC